MAARNNRSLVLSANDLRLYSQRLLTLEGACDEQALVNKVIHQDIFSILDWLPDGFVDLLFLDPPYNLDKTFNQTSFRALPSEDYAAWLESWLDKLAHVLKPTATVYICSEWRSSAAVQLVAEKYFKVRNRITWEREKGRGASQNWKNCSEDIWYCTVSDNFTFNVDAVKLMRRVLAPYTSRDGEPKDWRRMEAGNFRLTHPSNLWTDVTVPFWSMPENTSHPTQKPEKLVAKLVLASSQPGDLVFDPFLGSGTSAVVAKKLGRNYCGVDVDIEYCCMAEKRLEAAGRSTQIQGYAEGVFWERNSTPLGSRSPGVVEPRLPLGDTFAGE